MRRLLLVNWLKAVVLALSCFRLRGLNSAQNRTDAKPNVVLLIKDQWRHDWNSVDLPMLRTTTFNRIIADGTRFTKAIVPSPLCNPSRASLATGLAYPKHGLVDANKRRELAIGNRTIYQALRDAGVWTMTAGKDDLTKLGKFFGKPCSANASPKCGEKRAKQLGFDAFARCYGKDFVSHVSIPVDPYMMHLEKKCETTFKRYLNNLKSCVQPANFSSNDYTCPGVFDVNKDDYIDDWIALEAQRLIAEAPKDKPYFLQVNYAGPHPPLVITKAMQEGQGSPRKWPLAINSTTMSADLQQLIRENYALLIENIDGLNQDVLRTIEKRGDMNNTVICILSDHGEMLGDFWDLSQVYEPLEKTAPWQGSISVPLACMGPGVPAGRLIEDPVSTLDLASTVLELQGADIPRSYDSVSLLDTLQGGELPNKPVVSTLDFGIYRFSTALQRLEDGHVYKIICCKGVCPYGLELRAGATAPRTGWQRFLFDITKDAFELSDIYGSRPDIVRALKPSLNPKFQNCGETPSEAYKGEFSVPTTMAEVNAETVDRAAGVAKSTFGNLRSNQDAAANKRDFASKIDVGADTAVLLQNPSEAFWRTSRRVTGEEYGGDILTEEL